MPIEGYAFPSRQKADHVSDRTPPIAPGRALRIPVGGTRLTEACESAQWEVAPRDFVMPFARFDSAVGLLRERVFDNRTILSA